MTWADFKAAVEKEGVRDTDEIDYIDWTGHGEGVTVLRYPAEGDELHRVQIS